MSSEAFLRAFHARDPGVTSRVLRRGGSYARLAACIPAGARVLDLGCGDAPLGAGVDVSLDELRRACGPRVQARAQALPFVDASFDIVVSHLAFMLMDDAEVVARELDRVLVDGGMFAAMLGGGPAANANDAFTRFLELARPRGPRLGDRRTRSEAGWRTLFPQWTVTFERCAFDLGGSLDDVWAFLDASYEAHDDVRATLADELGTSAVPCTVVMWLATATKPGAFRR